LLSRLSILDPSALGLREFLLGVYCVCKSHDILIVYKYRNNKSNQDKGEKIGYEK